MTLEELLDDLELKVGRRALSSGGSGESNARASRLALIAYVAEAEERGARRFAERLDQFEAVGECYEVMDQLTLHLNSGTSDLYCANCYENDPNHPCKERGGVGCTKADR